MRLPIAALILVVTLTGCDAGSPPPAAGPSAPVVVHPTPIGGVPTPEPANDPDRAAESLIIDSGGIGVAAVSQEQLAYIPFTADPAEAVAQLADLIGEEPVVDDLPAASCMQATRRWTFGSLILVSPPDLQTPGETGFLFTAIWDGPATGSGVGILAPGSVQPGADPATVLANLPGSFLVGETYDGTIALEVGGGAGLSAWGVAARVRSGVVTALESPVYFEGSC